MSSSQAPEQSARRPFVTVPYGAAADDTLVASVPGRCPLALSDQRSCAVTRHHARVRKTGPCFPITVARCATHGQAFTLYPPGHRPYGRKSVAPATLQGELVLTPSAEVPAAVPGAVVPGKGSPPARRPAWSQTIFDAAIDAASGAAWSRGGSSESWPAGGSWGTQGRALVLDAQLLGIHPATSERSRERIASALDVPHLTLRDAARDFASARGYRSRGAAVVSVLDRLAPRRSLVDDLSYCGAVAGLWGRPSRWDPGGRVLRCTGVPASGNSAR